MRVINAQTHGIFSAIKAGDIFFALLHSSRQDILNEIENLAQNPCTELFQILSINLSCKFSAYCISTRYGQVQPYFHVQKLSSHPLVLKGIKYITPNECQDDCEHVFV
jgi:hypothetical protein